MPRCRTNDVTGPEGTRIIDPISRGFVTSFTFAVCTAYAGNAEYRWFGCEGRVCTNPDYFERNKDLQSADNTWKAQTFRATDRERPMPYGTPSIPPTKAPWRAPLAEPTAPPRRRAAVPTAATRAE